VNLKNVFQIHALSQGFISSRIELNSKINMVSKNYSFWTAYYSLLKGDWYCSSVTFSILINYLAVEMILNGDMRHSAVWRSAVPMLYSRRSSDDIALPDLLLFTIPLLNPASSSPVTIKV